MNRDLIAHTPLGEAWWAVSMTGHEALGELYEFRVGLKSDDPDIDTQSLLGEVAAVELIAQGGLSRYFSGQIVKVSALGLSGRHWAYEVTLAPKLWLATRRSDYRIWQQQSVREIANAVLQANALRCEWQLKNTYKTWEYLVQYGETDFAFLSRLFEREGIYYWFEHGLDGEKMVLGDHFSIHEAFGGYKQIPFYMPGSEGVSDEDHYDGWAASREPEPGRFKHTDYDFQHPSLDLTTEYSDPRGHLFDQCEIYAYPGGYTETSDGKAYATTRREALQKEQDVTELEGSVRGAMPGYSFTLYNHPRADQNRDYLITRARYEVRIHDYETTPDANEQTCRMRIGAIPADRQFRPGAWTPKPCVRGPETAVVVGPEGSEIHTDQYGRVKVHFPWDRYGARDGSDTCWIRVSTTWAGRGFGAISIPRVGHEVIIDYEHGNPDRPIIIGQVYNAEEMPPWELPANKTQSGVLSRSSILGSPDNANALRFDDAKGNEQVWLHAERNQDIEVEADETHWVGKDRTKTIDGNETTTVHKNRTETVDGNETITIHQDRTKTVDGTETSKIKKNKAETIMLASVQSVGAARMDNVGLAYNLNVGAAQVNIIGGLYSLDVGRKMITIVGNAQETIVQKGDQEVTVQQGNQKITVVSGKQTTYAARKIRFEAGDEDITLVCGDANIVVAPDSIVLKAGGAEVMINKAGVTVNGTKILLSG